MVRFVSIFIFIVFTERIAERVDFGNVPEIAKAFKIYKALLQDVRSLNDVHFDFADEEADLDDSIYRMMYKRHSLNF